MVGGGDIIRAYTVRGQKNQRENPTKNLIKLNSLN